MASAPVSSAPRTPIALHPPRLRHRSGLPPARCRAPAPAPAASIRARCAASAGQIPIVPAEPGAPLPAPSFPGGFRTPALVPAEALVMGPASETRHMGGHGIDDLATSLLRRIASEAVALPIFSASCHQRKSRLSAETEDTASVWWPNTIWPTAYRVRLRGNPYRHRCAVAAA